MLLKVVFDGEAVKNSEKMPPTAPKIHFLLHFFVRFSPLRGAFFSLESPPSPLVAFSFLPAVSLQVQLGRAPGTDGERVPVPAWAGVQRIPRRRPLKPRFVYFQCYCLLLNFTSYSAKFFSSFFFGIVFVEKNIP